MNTLKSNFIKYVTLNIMGMVGVSCYVLADTFFIAQAVGTVGLASLNFSLAVFSFLQGFGLMVAIGGATKFAITSQQNKGKNSAFTNSLFLGGLVALVFVTIALFFVTPLSKALGADEETLALTETYLRTLLSFSPLFILSNILQAFIRNDQAPKLAMTATVVSSICNIFFDYIFMFPLDMGMFGAALATGFSPGVSILILSLHFIKKKNTFHIEKCKIRLKSSFKLLSLGFSSFVGELASGVSLIIFNLIIFNFQGNTGVAAYGIIANVAIVAIAFIFGVAQGLQPLASKFFGLRDMKSTSSIRNYGLFTGLLISTVTYALIFIFAKEITAVFNSSNDEILAQLSINGMRIYFIGLIFASVNIVACSYLSGINHAKFGIAISILRSFVVLIPCIFIFSSMFNMTGVWLSFVVTEFIVMIITLIIFRKTTLSS